jgi:hypothetical protein
MDIKVDKLVRNAPVVSIEGLDKLRNMETRDNMLTFELAEFNKTKHLEGGIVLGWSVVRMGCSEGHCLRLCLDAFMGPSALAKLNIKQKQQIIGGTGLALIDIPVIRTADGESSISLEVVPMPFVVRSVVAPVTGEL